MAQEQQQQQNLLEWCNSKFELTIKNKAEDMSIEIIQLKEQKKKLMNIALKSCEGTIKCTNMSISVTMMWERTESSISNSNAQNFPKKNGNISI